MFLFRKLSGRSGVREEDSFTSSHDKDETSKQALEEASKYVSEGNYEEALWLLEGLGKIDPSIKGIAELEAVAEVCNAATSGACSCSRGNKHPDWYKILKVNEDSDVSAIKKQYRNLALLLHPDKNKHVKAEAAFKLVSEAYACLSDKRKRDIFNLTRSCTKCKHCLSKAYDDSGSQRWPGHHVFKGQEGLHRPGSSPDLTQMDWALDQERLKMFRVRARARVLGNLERLCKERSFTGLKKTSIIKEALDKRFRREMKRNTSFCGSNMESSNAVEEKQETGEKTSSVTTEKSIVAEDNVRNEVKEGKFSHWKLLQNRKNLGILIRDLQAEYTSKTGRTEFQTNEHNGLRQEYSPESIHRTAIGCSETRLNGQSAASRTNVNMNLTAHTSQTVKVGNNAASTECRARPSISNYALSLSVPGFLCHDDASDPGSCASKNDATRQNFDEEFMVDSRKEFGSKFDTPVSAIVTECEDMKDNSELDLSRALNQDEDSACAILRNENLCGRTHQNESLYLEEVVLRNQREKSEHLLRTLEQLREETKTVAASLNHLYFGRS